MSWITDKHIAEKRAAAAAKVDDAGKILNAAQTENRDVTAEEREKFDALHAEAKKIGDEISRLESQRTAELCFAAKQNLDQPFDKKDIKRYSILKAIGQMADKNATLDGIEKEVSDEIARRTGKPATGFYMPTSLPCRMNNAFVEGVDTTTGAGAIQTTVDATQFIEILRNRMVLKQAGVRFIGDLVGNLALPKQTAGATSYWVTDGNSPTAGAPTIGQVVFTPSICGAYTDLSRNFIKQTSLDAEMFARDDLAKSIAHELDRAGLNGSGSSPVPMGLLNNTSVATVSLGTNGAAPTWVSLVDCESTVASLNGDIEGEIATYVCSSSAMGTFKTTAKTSSGYPVFLWENNMINGCPALHTNSMPSNLTKGSGTNLSSLVYGFFSEMIIAQWGGIDILVNPYTGSSGGNVRVVALSDIAINVRHPESFAKIVDIVTD